MIAMPADGEKRAGQVFWDSNPCGGQWTDYESFSNWTTSVDPYVLAVLNSQRWAGLDVLEVGCGQGVMLNHLVRRGAIAYGIDMSRTSLKNAKAGAAAFNQSAQVHVSLADAEALPFADAAFDAVVSLGVLHHTPDTRTAVRQLRRVLKPRGFAIVMLYRSGTPKWWAARSIRRVSAVFDRLSGQTAKAVSQMRANGSVGDPKGTALLELFGVPTMSAFSNAEAMALFEGFSNVIVRNYQPGFRRLADLSPLLRRVEPLLAWIDRAVEQRWGFYQVVTARL